MRRTTASIRRELGAKRAKCRYRIREALENNGITIAMVAESLNIKPPAVTRVLSGAGHSEQILARMRAYGVPEKYLFDPNHNGNQDGVCCG